METLIEVNLVRQLWVVKSCKRLKAYPKEVRSAWRN